MAEGNLEGTVWVEHERLGDYEGTLTEQLRELLGVFNCDINILVNTYTYKGEGV